LAQKPVLLPAVPGSGTCLANADRARLSGDGSATVLDPDCETLCGQLHTVAGEIAYRAYGQTPFKPRAHLWPKVKQG